MVYEDLETINQKMEFDVKEKVNKFTKKLIYEN